MSILALLLGMAHSQPADATPEKAKAVMMKVVNELRQNEACVQRVESSLSFERYARLKADKPTSGGGVPADQEIAVLLELHSAYQPCDKLALEGVGKVSPAFVNWTAMTLIRRDESRLNLMTQKTNWASYVVRRIDDILEDAKQIKAIEAQIAEVVAEQLEWQAYEIEQRHLAVQSLQAWTSVQQQIQGLSPGKPISIVVCKYTGPQLRC